MKVVYKNIETGELCSGGFLMKDAHKWDIYFQAAEVLPLLKQARAEYLEQHSDGETDCVTPYDHLFYGRD